MSTVGKKLALVFGLAAGAAITALAVSKSGKREIKRLSDISLRRKNDLMDNIGRDLTRIKKMGKRFI